MKMDWLWACARIQAWMLGPITKWAKLWQVSSQPNRTHMLYIWILIAVHVTLKDMHVQCQRFLFSTEKLPIFCKKNRFNGEGLGSLSCSMWNFIVSQTLLKNVCWQQQDSIPLWIMHFYNKKEPCISTSSIAKWKSTLLKKKNQFVLLFFFFTLFFPQKSFAPNI